MVRHERLRWFEHLEHKGVGNWMLAYRNLKVVDNWSEG